MSAPGGCGTGSAIVHAVLRRPVVAVASCCVFVVVVYCGYHANAGALEAVSPAVSVQKPAPGTPASQAATPIATLAPCPCRCDLSDDQVRAIARSVTGHSNDTIHIVTIQPGGK